MDTFLTAVKSIALGAFFTLLAIVFVILPVYFLTTDSWWIGVTWLVIEVVVLCFFVEWKSIQNGTAVIFTSELDGGTYVGLEMIGFSLDSNCFIIKTPAGCQDQKEFGKCRLMVRFGRLVLYIKRFVKFVVEIPLKQIQLDMFLKQAETAAPDNLGLNVKFVALAEPTNPYLVYYKAPANVALEANKRSDGSLRGWVKSGNDEHVQKAKGNGVALWDELVHPDKLNCLSVFEKMETDWGYRIIPESIIVADVMYDERTQNALDEKRQNELEGEAEIRKMELQVKIAEQKGKAEVAKQEQELLRQRLAAQGTAQELFGPVVAVMASLRHMTVEEFEKELKTDKGLRAELDQYVKDLYSELQKFKTGAVKEYRGLEGGGIFSAILARFLEGGSLGGGSGSGGGGPSVGTSGGGGSPSSGAGGSSGRGKTSPLPPFKP